MGDRERLEHDVFSERFLIKRPLLQALEPDPAGAPVLLIHGGLGHADLWANQVRDLMKDHTVIVADSRGHGRS